MPINRNIFLKLRHIPSFYQFDLMVIKEISLFLLNENCLFWKDFLKVPKKKSLKSLKMVAIFRQPATIIIYMISLNFFKTIFLEFLKFVAHFISKDTLSLRFQFRLDFLGLLFAASL